MAFFEWEREMGGGGGCTAYRTHDAPSHIVQFKTQRYDSSNHLSHDIAPFMFSFMFFYAKKTNCGLHFHFIKYDKGIEKIEISHRAYDKSHAFSSGLSFVIRISIA